jgi:hypothetical protein
MSSKKSYSTNKYGRITQQDYTEKRSDGKTETRHYTRYGTYTGKTVSDGKRSQSYNRYGGKKS